MIIMQKKAQCKSFLRPSLWVFFCLILSATTGWALELEYVSPPAEDCAISEAWTGPGFTNLGPGLIVPNTYGRLVEELRVIAQEGNALEAIANAAALYYQYLTIQSRWPLSFRIARASADLAVSGRRAYTNLRSHGLSRSQWINYSALHEATRARVSAHNLTPNNTVLFDAAISFAVNRAFDVAWALRGPVEYRRNHRDELGWIAVSGEDDRPHRPVNTTSALYPQHNIRVTVGDHTVDSRVVFIQPESNEDTTFDRNQLPRDEHLPVLIGDVFLFLHGHGSTAEEAIGLAEALITQARNRGRQLTIIAPDLPGYGYSNSVRLNRLPALPLDTNPRRFGGLELLEEFVNRLVEQLETNQPGISRQIHGVIGGSLGGNLSLRLSRRFGDDHPWLGDNVAWSPASIWTSFADACEGQNGYSGCGFDHLSIFGETEATRETAVYGSRNNFLESVRVDTRGDFFSKSLLRSGGRANYKYADRWYSAEWPCKEQAIEASKYSVGEFFSETYRKWHWRVAHEQLIYTHWDYRDEPGVGIRSRLLLAAGTEDNHNPEFIYANTVGLSFSMATVPGNMQVYNNVGHSIHTENPSYFAERILDFIADVPSAPLPAFLISTII